MNESDWKTVKEIFLEALEINGAERAAFVAKIADGNPKLREEVESLLAEHSFVEGFIEEPVLQIEEIFANGADPTEKQFGNYKIIGEIGAGGMGAVFLAERSDGEFSQQVAIKIIRQALAESEIINRFRRERQILASLNHPNLSEQERRAVATTRSTLASTLADQGKFEEALETAREAVEEYQKHGEIDSPSYGFALTVYGGFLTGKGEFEKAGANLKQAETIFRQVFSATNLWLGDNLRNQAGTLYGQGNYPEAIEKADAALKIYEESFGKHYDNYPTALVSKGLSLTKIGKMAEGEKILREAVKIRAESLPKEHFWVAIAKSALGESLLIQKRFEEAEPLLTESYENLKTSQGLENPRTLLAGSRLAALYEKTNRTELAAQYR